MSNITTSLRIKINLLIVKALSLNNNFNNENTSNKIIKSKEFNRMFNKLMVYFRNNYNLVDEKHHKSLFLHFQILHNRVNNMKDKLETYKIRDQYIENGISKVNEYIDKIEYIFQLL